jgi:hypothetical protein
MNPYALGCLWLDNRKEGLLAAAAKAEHSYDAEPLATVCKEYADTLREAARVVDAKLREFQKLSAEQEQPDEAGDLKEGA